MRLKLSRAPLSPVPFVSIVTDTDWLDDEKVVSRLPSKLPLNRTLSLPGDAVPDAAPEALYVRSSQTPETLSPSAFKSLLRSSKLEAEPFQRKTTLRFGLGL